MSNNKVIDVIQQVAKQNKIKIDVINDKDQTLKSLKIDSLAVMNMIMEIESKLNVTLDDDALRSIQTLNDLIDAFIKAVNNQ